MPSFTLPPYAYVPGQNERHAENAFEPLRRTAEQGLDVAQLARSDAFCAGLQFFHAGFHWEAHEVLEPVWMALPEGGLERRFVQGLIQLANGRLKLRMGRPKAVLRLVDKARALVPTQVGVETIMSVEVRDVHCWIDSLEYDIKLSI